MEDAEDDAHLSMILMMASSNHSQLMEKLREESVFSEASFQLQKSCGAFQNSDGNRGAFYRQQTTFQWDIFRFD